MIVMGEMTARFKPGQNVPVFAGSQITAGRFVKITGAKTTNGDYPAAHAGAGEWAFGVAEMDSAPTTYAATATDRRVNVIRPGAIARVVAGAAVSVGAKVQSNAAGKAITLNGGVALGKALTAAGAEDDVIEVELLDPAPVGAAVANAGAIAAAAGEATAAALADTQALRTTVNDLLASLRAADIIDT